MAENDPVSLCRAMPDRHVMLKGAGRLAVFLLSPQS